MEESKFCLSKKHAKTKLCCIGGILVVLVVVAVVVIKSSSDKVDDVDHIVSNIKAAECQTETSKKNTERIGYLIDSTVDPCDDFFQYVCSSKKRGQEFPYARADVSLNLTELVVKASGDFSFLSDFYESCVSISNQFSTLEVAEYCLKDDKCSKEELSKFGSIYQEFQENVQYFASATSWPVLTKNWEKNANKFTWQKLSEDILKQEYYLGAFQYVNETSGTENFFSNVFFAPMIDHSVNNGIYNLHLQFEKEYTSKIHIIPMTFPKLLTENNSEDLAKYKQIMMSAMKVLGANMTVAEVDMSKVLENEKKLAKLSKYEYSYDSPNFASGGIERVSLSEMNTLFPLFNWTSFVNTILNNPNVTVDGSEKVLIPGKGQMRNMYSEINKMSKREQANLLLWRIFAKFSTNFLKTGNEEGVIYENIFDTDGFKTSRSDNCVNQIKTFFPNIHDDLTINNYLLPKEKEQIIQMFQNLKGEFENIINTSDWVQQETKVEALRKLKKMEINVGKISNNVEHNLETLTKIKADNYLGNIRILGNSFWSKRVLGLRAVKDPFPGEAIENAYHAPFLNQVQINVGFIKGSGIGYSKDLPRALIYGGFAALALGHELTHGFDNNGNLYDEDGIYRNWWDPQSRQEFDDKTSCMVDQYNEFVFGINGTTHTVNGRNTINENIADNGGIKIAYRAFLKANAKQMEVVPPALNLTAKQLFWVGYGQNLCLLVRQFEKYETFKDVLMSYKGGLHAPAPWRVNTVVSNQKEFAEDFKCRVGAKLNPENRCIVW